MKKVMLELFSGSGQMAALFKSKGWETYTIDYNPDLDASYHLDVYSILDKNKIKELCGGVFPSVIWISPDCTTYSIASISTHRYKNWDCQLLPKSEYAEYCDENNSKLMDFVRSLDDNTLWFIENPKGSLRKMRFMHHLPRYTVTYCQYGFEYQKPTDIWTNHPDPKFKPACKAGSSCHISAPRGSKTGIQGITGKKSYFYRSQIPYELCKHIYEISEEYFKESEKHEKSNA